MEFKVDYHIHTYFSDGVFSPEEIVDWNISRGNTSMAITDHDCIEGSKAAIKYAEDKNIKVIPGIEISAHSFDKREVHILGYGFDIDSVQLKRKIEQLKLWRKDRNNRILNALQEMGYRITLQELISENDGRYVGKPTFARILSKNGYIKNAGDAFKADGIFASENIKNIKKYNYSTREAVDIIHEAGGVAVMAHPIETKFRNEKDEDFNRNLHLLIYRLMGEGLDGIECYHPSASTEQSEKFKAFAEQHGLIETRGSDFHS